MNRPMRMSPTLALAEAVDRERRNGREAYSFSTPTFESLNPEILSRIRFRTTLTGSKGYGELREAARELLFDKWRLSDHECMISGGAKAAIFSILRACVEPGEKVLIISPHWPSYEDLATAAHLVPLSFATSSETGFAIEPSKLRSALEQCGPKAVICSNPGNPTGRVLSRREVASLCEATSNTGAVLLLDESFSRIVFDRERWTNSVCDAGSNVFVVNSFSKNFHLQGLRLGACMVPGEYFSAVASTHQTLLSSAPTLSQDLALGILDSSDLPNCDYSFQRQIVLEFLSSRGWRYSEPHGSFYVFPYVGGSDKIRDKLETGGIMTLPGCVFGSRYSEHLRICFGKPLSEINAILRLARIALG
ncbi:MAG: pyridoxal phosphate-dependent aminotransferase [Albidovulum sp.]|nr:pyridoxal phosphate-dependent aminotransferase [Albidovulum sp.]